MASLLVAATLLSYTSIKSARTKRAQKKRSRADARVDELKKWEEEEEDGCRGETGMTEKGKKVGKVAGRRNSESEEEEEEDGWRGSSGKEEDRGLVFGDKGDGAGRGMGRGG